MELHHINYLKSTQYSHSSFGKDFLFKDNIHQNTYLIQILNEGFVHIDAWKTKSNRCCVKDMKDKLVYFHQNNNHNIDIIFSEPYQEFNFDGDKDYIKRWYIRANKLIDNIPQDVRKAMYIMIWGI